MYHIYIWCVKVIIWFFLIAICDFGRSQPVVVSGFGRFSVWVLGHPT